MPQDLTTDTQIQIYTIFPTNKYNRPPPPSEVPLHGLDLLAAPIQIRNHRFYHPPTPTGKYDSLFFKKLKDSLAEALELYPAVAGTIKANEKGEAILAMGVNDRLGTPYTMEVNDIAFSGDNETLTPRHEQILPPISPTLAVKVTRFSCGTIAIATSLNHQVADLRGFLDFLETWAQLVRGDPVDLTLIPDDWSRTPGRFFPDYYKKSSKPPPPPGFAILADPATGPSPYLLAPSEASRWTLSKKDIERLKQDFSPSGGSNSKQWVSSGDAIAALLSGAITRAREDAKVTRLEGRSSVSSEIEIIAAAADGRERAPLGDMQGKYYGNFNPLFCTTVSRSDLLSPSNESSSRVALAIRNALTNQLSPQALADKISFFEAEQNSKPPGRIVWNADIILTNWSRFYLQGPKFDLGWGQPFGATAGSGGPYPPGYVVMMQDKRSEDIQFLVAIEKEGAAGLKDDPLLTKYAKIASVL
ncbi:transferase [Collybia nuda]|uniref:Transferase n=1 Tax=Collybia nuda TaxID=64659 RepID=A0A9P5YF22_9AGAR|nr:transferase [Collybia nuda]